MTHWSRAPLKSTIADLFLSMIQMVSKFETQGWADLEHLLTDLTFSNAADRHARKLDSSVVHAVEPPVEGINFTQCKLHCKVSFGEVNLWQK
jgi:hypothetical protein